MTDVVIVGIVAAIAPTGAVALAWWKHNGALRAVHRIVNSRLTKALKTIDDLKAEVRDLKDQLMKGNA